MTPPLHETLATELRRRIASGALAVGAPLPSEAQLCAEFGVSRGTVRQAVGALRAEGAVGGGRGRPPVVRPRALAQSFDSLGSFSAWALTMGRTPGQRTLEVARRPARREAADRLELEEGDPVVEVLRVRSLDGEPVMIERTAFVERVGRLLWEVDPDAGSLFAYLRGRGVDLSVARHDVYAVAADARDAELLGVPVGAPLLRERRRTASAAGEPLEFSDDRYRPDMVTFTIENAEAGARVGFARLEAA